MAEYDIALIAGRREVLLRRTLASFSEQMFRNFKIARVVANIDPFMGDADEGDRCEALIREYFPEATIFRPETPDFASAVARAWAATTASRVIHMEDDWISLELIEESRVDALFEPGVGSIAFMHGNKHTRGLTYQTVVRRFRDPAGNRAAELKNCHSTSPGVFDGAFLRKAASLMRPKMDPEAQFSRALNPELEEHAFPMRCVFLNGRKSRFLIEDIGREYRAAHGVVRARNRLEAIWIQLPKPDATEA